MDILWYFLLLNKDVAIFFGKCIEEKKFLFFIPNNWFKISFEVLMEFYNSFVLSLEHLWSHVVMLFESVT